MKLSLVRIRDVLELAVYKKGKTNRHRTAVLLISCPDPRTQRLLTRLWTRNSSHLGGNKTSFINSFPPSFFAVFCPLPPSHPHSTAPCSAMTVEQWSSCSGGECHNILSLTTFDRDYPLLFRQLHCPGGNLGRHFLHHLGWRGTLLYCTVLYCTVSCTVGASDQENWRQRGGNKNPQSRRLLRWTGTLYQELDNIANYQHM